MVEVSLVMRVHVVEMGQVYHVYFSQWLAASF